jgi:hypothetical protein
MARGWPAVNQGQLHKGETMQSSLKMLGVIGILVATLAFLRFAGARAEVKHLPAGAEAAGVNMSVNPETNVEVREPRSCGGCVRGGPACFKICGDAAFCSFSTPGGSVGVCVLE